MSISEVDGESSNKVNNEFRILLQHQKASLVEFIASNELREH